MPNGKTKVNTIWYLPASGCGLQDGQDLPSRQQSMVCEVSMKNQINSSPPSLSL